MPFGPAVEFVRQPWFGEPVCVRCEGSAYGLASPACEENGRHFPARHWAPEVNHIRPLNGIRPAFGCCHHQENLEVVCHDCHVAIGIEQRAAGLIGKPKPPAAPDLFVMAELT